MSLSGTASRLGGRMAGWLGPDKFIGVKTNWWKYGALGATGAAVGIGAFGALRPTYNTGGGPVVTQNAQDPFSGIMNSMMPLFMMAMMVPLMQRMTTQSSKKDSDEGDE